MPENSANHKSLESWIWDAACSIRGAKDAPKYKEYILPLVFTKRLCDVFDAEVNRIAREGRYTERLAAARMERRRQQPVSDQPDQPAQPVSD